jgi:hypothetical protein
MLLDSLKLGEDRFEKALIISALVALATAV